MKHFLVALTLLSLPALAQKPPFPACDCPVVNCPPCTHNEGQDFYSEKCGDDGVKTRSCSKPKCVDNADPKCVKASGGVAAAAPATAKDSSNIDPLGHAIGAVKVVKGSVQIVQADGSQRTVAVDQTVHEHDRIITGKDGSALLEFEGGNKIHVMPDTRMTVQEYENSEDSKRAVFNLLKGKIRNQVKQKYGNENGKQSRYEVITTGVVAGVRGTDFVVSEEDSITRFDTLEGTVELNQRIGEKAVQVNKNESVSYSLDDNYRGSGDWSNSAAQGFFGPKKILSDADATTIARATDLAYDVAKNVKIVKKKIEPIICKNPNGRLNQCSWHCENNPKKAKSCMLGKPNVACVRSRCNANGEWAEPMKIPVGSSDTCDATGAKVSDCDY